MSTDLFSQVQFTAGQEVRAVDLTDISKFVMSRITDQMMTFSLFGKSESVPNYGAFGGADDLAEVQKYGFVLSPRQAHFRRTTKPNEINLSPGTIYQLVDTPDGVTPQLLPYTFDGTELLTIASGGGVNPRVDIVQMKLELISTDTQDRVFKTTGDTATLDSPSTNVDTVIAARSGGGSYGNGIRYRQVAGGAPGLAEVGLDVTVTFVDGVTTVADIETLIDNDSTLLVVETPGTGANILVDPDDVIAYTALSGGRDGVLTSQSVDMKSRVQCTLSVKQGTAAASPTIPDPDAGYVMIAAVYVPSAHVASATPGDDKYWYINDAGATYTELTGFTTPAEERCFLMDMRMPIGLQPYTVFPGEFQYTNDGSNWTLNSSRRQLIQGDATPDGTTKVFVYCPHKLDGRLVAISAGVDDNSAAYDLTTKVFLSVELWFPGVGDMSDGIKMAQLKLLDSPGRSFNMIGGENGDDDFQRNHLASGWNSNYTVTRAVIQANGNQHGVPIWTSGFHAPGYNEGTVQAGRELLCDPDGFWLMVLFDSNVAQNVRLGPLTFWIAKGI